jgi:hypothetical protein
MMLDKKPDANTLSHVACGCEPSWLRCRSGRRRGATVQDVQGILSRGFNLVSIQKRDILFCIKARWRV